MSWSGSLSVVLPTIYRKDLIRSTLSSVLPQLSPNDELVISLNVPIEAVSQCEAELSEFLKGIEGGNNARFVSSGGRLRVFEHWAFAISQAAHEHIILIHDDEIYRRDLLSIARTEFGMDPEVSLIVGGQLNVYIGVNGLHAHQEIGFFGRRVADGKKWIQSQKNPAFPKFGATAYMFRRCPAIFPFLQSNTRVADALIIYALAASGKVVERPEYFGTHLNHATNTLLTDTLEVGHVPYWKGFRELGEKLGDDLLIQTSEMLKTKAVENYASCAVRAALPLGDKAGYGECQRQIRLAEGKPSPLMGLLRWVPLKWQLLPPLLRAVKKAGWRLKRARTAQSIPNESLIGELLEIDAEVLRDFRNRAIPHAR